MTPLSSRMKGRRTSSASDLTSADRPCDSSAVMDDTRHYSASSPHIHDSRCPPEASLCSEELPLSLAAAGE